jgi:hypothetical protein
MIIIENLNCEIWGRPGGGQGITFALLKKGNRLGADFVSPIKGKLNISSHVRKAEK